ncbi:hypothetical protein H4R99_000637 [Coemansia sp. RSA 1722]|nr:hypothetical protein IWW45_000520 [Coemansia sp. RSA 485]KAJ2606084.1 hypothetical protein H4R99_000637 [Coemansia sp. RSA 1722]
MAACMVASSVSGSIIAGYAPGWKDLSVVDISKYTHINLAYAEPQPNGTFAFSASYNVQDFTSKIHSAGSRALIALGGYSGSIYVSDALKNADSRGQLTRSIVDFIKDNNLDGVDMDWIANECNHVDQHNDAANLLVFVRELRDSLNSAFPSTSKKLISLGVGLKPFAGPDGPLSDVSEYAKWVDYINILAYDINGPEDKTTGPNSPLNYEFDRGNQQSLISAIDSWTQAKFPVNQITAGLAFYGRSSKSTVDMSTQPWNVYQPQESIVPRGDDDDGLWASQCNKNAPSFSGIWAYKNLRKQGVLKAAEEALAPWQRNWDSVSLTPWVFNPHSKTFISYDDPSSISAKANFVQGRGLAGVAVYDVCMDYGNELLSAITNILQPDPPLVPPQSQSQNSTEIISSSLPSPSPSPSTSEQSNANTSSATTSFIPTPSSSIENVETTSFSTWTSSVSDIPTSITATTSITASNSQGLPETGSSCGWAPAYRCMDSDGKSPYFMTCAAGIWVQQQCASGTACVQNGDYILCDWPR